MKGRVTTTTVPQLRHSAFPRFAQVIPGSQNPVILGTALDRHAGLEPASRA